MNKDSVHGEHVLHGPSKRNTACCRKRIFSQSAFCSNARNGTEYAKHRRRIKTEEKAKVVAAVWVAEFIQFLAALTTVFSMILKKRMNRIKAAWRNGGFDDHLVHTHSILNHHPTKMDVLPKTVVQIILANKCLVRNSTSS